MGKLLKFPEPEPVIVLPPLAEQQCRGWEFDEVDPVEDDEPEGGAE